MLCCGTGCDPECIDRVSPVSKPYRTQDGVNDSGEVLGGKIQFAPASFTPDAGQTEMNVLTQITFRCANDFWLKCPNWPPKALYASTLKLDYGTGDQSLLNAMQVVIHILLISQKSP